MTRPKLSQMTHLDLLAFVFFFVLSSFIYFLGDTIAVYFKCEISKLINR